MYLEIVTPEAILFSSEVDFFSAPGSNGQFQVLNNHAPIVSTLQEGDIKIHVHTQEHLKLDDLHGSLIVEPDNDKVLSLKINSGTLELTNNKAIILAD
jgi:F0F1-type ATP synthase, epsilon subunit (mitochondrial delta subunit)